MYTFANQNRNQAVCLFVYILSNWLLDVWLKIRVLHSRPLEESTSK